MPVGCGLVEGAAAGVVAAASAARAGSGSGNEDGMLF